MMEENKVNSSVSCDVAVLPRVMLLTRAAQQMLWYMLWRKASGAKVDRDGYMRVPYRDAQKMCFMQSKTHPYVGLQSLIEANFIERGPVAGWYRIVVNGIGLSEN